MLFNANDALETQVWSWLMYLYGIGLPATDTVHSGANMVEDFQTLMPLLEKTTGFQTNINMTVEQNASMAQHSATVQAMAMNMIAHVKLSNIQRDLLPETPFTRLDGMSEHAVYDVCSITSDSQFTLKYEGGVDVWLVFSSVSFCC